MSVEQMHYYHLKCDGKGCDYELTIGPVAELPDIVPDERQFACWFYTNLPDGRCLCARCHAKEFPGHGLYYYEQPPGTPHKPSWMKQEMFDRLNPGPTPIDKPDKSGLWLCRRPDIRRQVYQVIAQEGHVCIYPHLPYGQGGFLNAMSPDDHGFESAEWQFICE